MSFRGFVWIAALVISLMFWGGITLLVYSLWRMLRQAWGI